MWAFGLILGYTIFCVWCGGWMERRRARNSLTVDAVARSLAEHLQPGDYCGPTMQAMATQPSEQQMAQWAQENGCMQSQPDPQGTARQMQKDSLVRQLDARLSAQRSCFNKAKQ